MSKTQVLQEGLESAAGGRIVGRIVGFDPPPGLKIIVGETKVGWVFERVDGKVGDGDGPVIGDGKFCWVGGDVGSSGAGAHAFARTMKSIKGIMILIIHFHYTANHGKKQNRQEWLPIPGPFKICFICRI